MSAMLLCCFLRQKPYFALSWSYLDVRKAWLRCCTFIQKPGGLEVRGVISYHVMLFSKGPRKMRKHFCGNIVYQNVSWACKLMQWETMVPCWINQQTFHWKQAFAHSQFGYQSLHNHRIQSTLFPWCANGETFVAETKITFLKKKTRTFLFLENKMVSATTVSFANKRGNI